MYLAVFILNEYIALLNITVVKCALYDMAALLHSIIIIIIMAEMAVFYVAGYLIEERRKPL